MLHGLLFSCWEMTDEFWKELLAVSGVLKFLSNGEKQVWVTSTLSLYDTPQM